MSKAFRSLGFYAIEWIETFLVHGPGDVQGRRIRLDDEFAEFILKAYQVDGHGARRVRRAFLSRAKGRAKCLSPSTLVAMADGSRRAAADVRAGDAVLTGFGMAPVIGTEWQSAAPMVRIRTDHGRELTVTADHPILSRGTLWRAGMPNMWRYPSCDPKAGAAHWVKAADLMPGDRVVIGIDWEGQGDLDPESGWILGVFVGDGSGGGRLANPDPQILARVDSVFPLTWCKGPNSCNWYARGSRPFLRDHHLCDVNAYTKRVPAAVMVAKRETVLAFLAGYLDTDGFTADDRRGKKRCLRIAWGSVNRALLMDCQHLLAGVGINASVSRHDSTYRSERYPSWLLSVTDSKQVSQLAGLLLPYICRPHKKAALTSFAEYVAPRCSFADRDTDRIRTVEKIPDNVSIAIEVRDVHTHITDGIITHNSELAAMIECFEALGECRFDHWAKDGEAADWGYTFEAGEPVGRQLRYAECLNVATEEGQAGNTYDNVYYMLHRDTCAPELLDRFGKLDVGLTRINLPDFRGIIEPATASNESKDGAKSTFVVADEPLALDTRVPTPAGWVTMGDIAAGDFVFGVDGQPVLVWGISPVKYERPCYRVTFDDGTSVVSDARHPWVVFDRKSKHRWVEHTTVEMMHANWYGSARFAVPAPDPLHGEQQDLPLDPYVLGLWLGDGDNRCATISVGRNDLDHVLEQLADADYSTQVYDYDPNKGAVAVRFNHGKRSAKSGTSQHVLRELEVLQNKHVPELYLWASIDQRLALLQGLMDSDGYVNNRGNCTFTNSSRVLADAVTQLARSFGWRASIGNWSSDERWQCRTAGTWRVSFTPAGCVPFRLKRKASRCRTAAVDAIRGIAEISPVESVPVRCIAVDSVDHLFLVGDSMLPTHNTHLWTPPGSGVNRLARMHQTIVRNLLKRKEASGWMLETSTMFAEGENSVAEGTHAYAKALEASGRSEALLFDHRQASDRWDLDNRADRIKALREAYGPAAAWMDLRSIADYWDDPQASHAEFRRFWLNQPIPVADLNPFDLTRWMELRDTDMEAPDRVALVIDVSPDRKASCIGIAGEVGGRMVVDCYPMSGMAGVADKVAELVDSGGVDDVAVTSGQARALEPDLTRLGVEYRRLSGTELGAAFAAFQQAVVEGTLTHPGRRALDAAVAGVRARRLGSGEIEVVDRRELTVDVTSLISCSAALYRFGLLEPAMPAFY